ncbi:FHA domain-containing protein [Chloroflexota bacterium]
MWVPTQFLLPTDAWLCTLSHLWWRQLPLAPRVSQDLLVVIFGVLLYIILSLIAILIWVFLVRPIFKRPAAKRQATTQSSESPASQLPPAPAQMQAPVSEQPVEDPTGLQLVLDSGEIHDFTELPISIGRAEQNDLVLDDETISAQHARIFFDDVVKEICIADLDSMNGVFINDQPTRKNILRDSARVRLGSVHLVFRASGHTPPNSA